jgi:hypothetical protein
LGARSKANRLWNSLLGTLAAPLFCAGCGFATAIDNGTARSRMLYAIDNTGAPSRCWGGHSSSASLPPAGIGRRRMWDLAVTCGAGELIADEGIPISGRLAQDFLSSGPCPTCRWVGRWTASHSSAPCHPARSNFTPSGPAELGERLTTGPVIPEPASAAAVGLLLCAYLCHRVRQRRSGGG